VASEVNSSAPEPHVVRGGDEPWKDQARMGQEAIARAPRRKCGLQRGDERQIGRGSDARLQRIAIREPCELDSAIPGPPASKIGAGQWMSRTLANPNFN